MEQNAAATAFATLGHPDRLAVFRLLMRFAPRGVRPTEIAAALGIKANTLSHHLSDLAGAGLVQVTRQGRSLYYRVNLPVTEALIGYLALDVGRARPDLMTALRASATEVPAADKSFNVLFICSGNSARSLFAEALLRDLGGAKFQAFSAGTRPGSTPNPFALDILARNGHDMRGMSALPQIFLRMYRAFCLSASIFRGRPHHARWAARNSRRRRRRTRRSGSRD